MTDTSPIAGLLSVGLGLYSAGTRKVELGALMPEPQFTLTGASAVVLGIALTAIGVWLLTL